MEKQMANGKLRWAISVAILSCLGLISIPIPYVMAGAEFIPNRLVDSAEVVPKGVFRIAADAQIYLPIRERFGPDGDVEEIAQDFNAELNGSVFPSLKLLEQFFHLPDGSANIGRSVVSSEFQTRVFESLLAYGLTDRLTVGVKIPYWFVRNNIDSELDTSHATVGKNPFLNSLVPLFVPGTVPLTTKDVLNLLGRGLDVNGDGRIDIKGYGYSPFKTWSQNGIADIEGGFKYLYLKTDDWRLAGTIAARFPTGDIDNTDDLADYPFGTGAWGGLLILNNDYTGIKNLLLDFTFRYKAFFPDTKTLRVPLDVNSPITANKEDVHRDIGDIFEFEFSGTYQFASGWSIAGLYRYGFSLKNQVSGRSGIDFAPLEEETEFAEHVGMVVLTYSTVPLFQAGKCSVPINASIAYRNRFAGQNALKTQYVGFGVSVFF
jgi:hypothetical protein